MFEPDNYAMCLCTLIMLREVFGTFRFSLASSVRDRT